ncbi:MAG: 7-carboxy-7-deazaguanine synthase QueE [Euryarchaeota archaeon]|nr:7-carboxy-7-deazaguanine synthase QueE [Euryarchaeota archaeon]MBV1728816.1 7-carboxy-7-deazaguanine synthase QueE [Methanobacterium sp.]MBU4547424.1 7-carboxy-7-deazaguanine synthase QueE [Euryarchaeota archaeon]MBU4608413.1 7-carboxy-7-deazaguanine synthase QueE [Euryarchaeota archaeon]MBV1755477.1 7-carboxy-7-deazaguanine synthase QueE [Methanobacterium sp.]
MKAPIMEVFSSIQGEGKLIGRRQIFIRFAGCNLDCIYCDTPESKNADDGDEISVEELSKTVHNLLTPDFHSISFTGGEPSLQADFIKLFLERNDFKSMLETNGSLPSQIKKIAGLMDYASVDIKLPEHFAIEDKGDLWEKEVDSLNILIEKGANSYCKVVVLPTTKVDTVELMAQHIKKELARPSKVSLVIQPASPVDYWVKHTPELFKMSEKAGKHMDVLTIPQIHKLLKVR